MPCRESLRRHISYFGTLRLIRGPLVSLPRGWLMGLLGWMCPKRRGLKPRWRGCLQETVRWPGVFVVFPVCFGVALHGARADLLRFGHLAPSLRHADIRAGPSPQRVGLGWDARGRVSIVVDEGLHRQRGCGADHEGRGLIIRDGRRRSRPPATRSVGRSPRKASRSSSCSSAGCRLLWRTAADRSPMRLRTP